MEQMKTITDSRPSFAEWPERRKGSKEDVPCARAILGVFAPVVQSLIDTGLTGKTIVHHCFNLWLHGGETRRGVSTYNKYNANPYSMVIASIGPGGGILCRHHETERDMNSYDSTCGRLYKFLVSSEEAATAL